MSKAKKRYIIVAIQIASVLMLILSFSAAYREADAFIANNSKDYKLQQMQAGELEYSYSTFSKNNLMVTCFDAMNSIYALVSGSDERLQAADLCAAQAKAILKTDPAFALAWVVIADRHFIAGDIGDAQRAMMTAYEIAPAESWISKSRVAVLLKHEDKVDFKSDVVFKHDVALLMGKPREIRWLASKWKSVETARSAIEIVLSEASPDIQRVFLRLVRKVT